MCLMRTLKVNFYTHLLNGFPAKRVYASCLCMCVCCANSLVSISLGSKNCIFVFLSVFLPRPLPFLGGADFIGPNFSDFGNNGIKI